MNLENRKPGKNEFFDIKPLKDWGIIWFPISMSNISTSQSVKKCIEWINFFGEKKVGEPKIGLNVSYTDFLYLNSDEKASKLKEKFMFQMVNHKNGFKKMIYKNRIKNQILHAFHFESFGNLYLEIGGDFNDSFKKIKELYKKDKNFQKYLKEDSKFFKRKLTKNQSNFFLEEDLVTYLILSMKVNFRNEYVQGREKWILFCYPGSPLKSQVYLCQSNPFKFKLENPYYGGYNLLNKKFYDFKNLDLETWNYE
ncbi:hypothetical protein J4412_00880 [Candidatus Pacearchaeota archaeon]|nr:MAG: hypothetical protein QJ16_C0005G0002 [archaeon GW2011_AR1]MBS3078043.1 hypothetical protein [Candidatus Pacearchaeota archaeon]